MTLKLIRRGMFPKFLRKKRVRQWALADGVYVQIGFSNEINQYAAQIYIEMRVDLSTTGCRQEQVRDLYGDTRREIMAKIRLALSKGPTDIHWDVLMMKRLVVKESGVHPIWARSPYDTMTYK